VAINILIDTPQLKKNAEPTGPAFFFTLQKKFNNKMELKKPATIPAGVVIVS
jgi:hypothetical protein